MIKLKLAKAELNRVSLKVDLQGHDGAYIYRARRVAGPYEEVGVARSDTYVDTADLEAGKTYYYRSAPWLNPWYYPEPADLSAIRPIKAQIPRAPKEKRLTLTRKRQTFTLRLGGQLDENNTVTKGPEEYCPGPGHMNPPYDQIFEPNLYVAIENTGDTDVENPRVVANGRRDWFSIEAMAREILQRAGGRRASEGEKALAVWQFLVDEVYDSRAGLSWRDSFADPVKLCNVYGFEGCVANAVASSRLARALGLKAREVWMGDLASIDGYGRGRVCSHAIFEAHADGTWQFLDTDLMVFFLNRDNRTVASVEDLARDFDLVRRSHRNLGLCGRDMPDKVYYEQYFQERMLIYPPGDADLAAHPPPHTMALRLRPGEKLIRYWDNIGKNVIRSPYLHPDLRFANGKLVYRPDLRQPLALKGLESAQHIARGRSRSAPALHPERSGQPAELVWKITSPYAIAGARVGFKCRRQTRADGLEVLFSKDGHKWRSLWLMAGHANSARQNIARELDASLALDWFLNPALHDWRDDNGQIQAEEPCYAYYIKVAIWAGSKPCNAGLDAIRFDTDIQCATRSLPSLFCGDNAIAYCDDNRTRRKVRLTYGWREEHRIRPPQAPVPVFPQDGKDVSALDFEFRWRRPKGGSSGVDEYHIQISRYPDFRFCVCPTFDRYVGRTQYAGQTRWQPEFPNLLNPDQTYYWRVRARNAQGAWGPWSTASAFVPHGPALPLDLAVRRRGGRRLLTWRANPQGNPAVAYRIYGAKEKGGFSAGDENLLGTTTANSWPIAHESFSYRVVAIDDQGIASTPSDHFDPSS